ncbi:transposase, IS4-like family protein [Klebsiella sp. AS10]|nr:transposase, IS4-like family protein [Klebsiella sp. AS10]
MRHPALPRTKSSNAIRRCIRPRKAIREELAEVDVDWLIAERPGRVKTLKQHPRKNKTAINIEYMKASIRARGEHPFRIIKRQFGFVKARYKGLLKNDNQLAMLFTLANLFRVDQMIRQWERSQ